MIKTISNKERIYRLFCMLFFNTQYSLRFIPSHINDKEIPGLHSFVSLADTLLAG